METKVCFDATQVENQYPKGFIIVLMVSTFLSCLQPKFNILQPSSMWHHRCTVQIFMTLLIARFRGTAFYFIDSSFHIGWGIMLQFPSALKHCAYRYRFAEVPAVWQKIPLILTQARLCFSWRRCSSWSLWITFVHLHLGRRLIISAV